MGKLIITAAVTGSVHFPSMSPYLPITPFFPLFGIFGTLPLPTKWFIRIGKPIRLPHGGDLARAERETSLVRRRLQAMVTRLKQRRRSIFLG